MLEILKAKNYSQKTCEVYKKWVEAFLLKYNHRNNLGQKEINDFLTELAVKKHVSPSTQNQALASLLFYFRFVKNENPVELASVNIRRRPKSLNGNGCSLRQTDGKTKKQEKKAAGIWMNPCCRKP